MTVLSTSCQCSACRRKYTCLMYRQVVDMQKFTSKYCKEFMDKVDIRFQVEKCKKRLKDNVVCKVETK